MSNPTPNPQKTTQEGRDDVSALSRLIGARVLLLNPHPWATHAGEVVAVERFPVGWGLIVEMDNGLRAGVFKAWEMRILSRPGGEK